MAKIVDITEKLNFEEKPQLKIKGELYTVNDSAVGMLKLMPLISGDVTPDAIVKMYELLFSVEDRKRIDAVKLNFEDFTTFIMQAVTLVAGEQEQGEVQTPAMT